ncbi:MAG: lysostaphin resistance A-like protein [Huintestinicola sp.]|uniref:CPBP family intramembrane glutamic endopeptidase n=1 Tax=Huintestinicola sp. TaxID=2981661 RepID=UPI003F1207FC
MSDINENTNTTLNKTESEASAPEYSWGQQAIPEEGENPVMLRRKIKSGYNWAGSLIIWQQVIAMVIMMVITSVMSASMVPQIIAEHPDYNTQQLSEALSAQLMSGNEMVYINAVTMVAANIISLIIICVGKKQFKLKSVLGRIQSPASSVVLACVGILGIQGASILIQNLVMGLTGYSGINETVTSAMSFSDDVVTNIMLFIYMVIAAPVLEELMFRGAVMNLLAPVNRTFALLASAMFFGLMHCNFNQMFNGFLLGLVFGYIALKSGSVISSVICHMTANLNAFIIGYIFEYKLAPSIGAEAAATGEMIVFAIEMVIGIIALVLLWKKQGKLTNSDIIVTDYSYTFDDSEEKKLCWQALLKCPTFWVSAVLCVGTACTLVTAL